MKRLRETIKWYDRHAQEYEVKNRSYYSLAKINDFIRLLPKNANVLDAGCGTGRDSKLLSDKGCIVTGLDLSAGMIALARKKYPGLQFVQDDLLNLPFTNASFDGIWAMASLVHLESVSDVEKALQEFHRILKKGGVLHVTVQANIESKKFAVSNERFYQYFTKEEMEKLVTQAGFKIKKLYQYTDENTQKKYGRRIDWLTCLSTKK